MSVQGASATSNNSSLKDIMNSFSELWASTEKLYLKTGTATEINTQEHTFTFNPIDDSAPLTDVKMKTLANSDRTDFIIVIPKENSIVTIAYESSVSGFCILVAECEEFLINCDDVKVETDSWVFNGGDLQGLINIVDLTSKLNQLNSKVNDLITKFNTHIHSGVTTGGGVSGTPTTTETSNPAFDKDDYEDIKIKH